MTPAVRPHRILVSSLWAIYNMSTPAERCNAFLRRSKPSFRHLIDGVLLNDEVLVPTQDFIALPVIVRELGSGPFLDLLLSGCFRFIRFPAAIGYAGNGAGMMAYGIQYSDGRQRPITACVADSARAALEGVGMVVDGALLSAVERATTELDVPSTFNAIEAETYKDVQKSEYLRRSLSLRSNDFRKLPGVAPNEARIYGGPDLDWDGEIGTLLALATTNLELRIAQICECDDSATSSPVQHLLRAKVERLAHPRADVINTFATLRQMADIPDISLGILDGSLNFSELLKLRGSRNAVQFRHWFHDHRTDDPVLLAKEYIALLKEIPSVQSMPVRIMRFVISTVAGLIPGAGIVVGPTISAIDSFFVDRLFGKNSARIFVEELQRFARGAG